jgi:hypothetical protein
MLPARIEAKFVPEPMSGCWLWTVALHQGYGYVGWEGRTRKAATVIYELLRGPVPPGLELDHLCPADHPFDAVNTYVWQGSRYCRACRSAAMQRCKDRKAAVTQVT